MASFRHKRTGKIIDVSESNAGRYRNGRYEEIGAKPSVPSGTVAEILAWAGDDVERRRAALFIEKAGKNRKSLIDKLT